MARPGSEIIQAIANLQYVYSSLTAIGKTFNSVGPLKKKINTFKTRLPTQKRIF